MVKVSILFANFRTLPACKAKCELLRQILVRFLLRKTNTKVISPTNHNRCKQRDEPISIELHIIFSKRGKIPTHKLRLFLVLASHWLENWRDFLVIFSEGFFV